MLESRFQEPQGWAWQFIANADGARLLTGALALHKKPKAHLILGPGMREFAEKYFETARDFSALGYNVHVINWRGQGGSEKVLPDRFHRAALGFDRDARDLTDFMRNHIPDDAPKVYLGHSMGGLIGLLAMAKSGGVFAASSLLAPFLGFSDKRSSILEKALNAIPFRSKTLERFIPGGKPWHLRESPQNMSSDPARMSLHDHWTASVPSLRLGDLTLGGFKDATRAIASLRAPGGAERIAIPTLLYSAGQEKLVSTREIFNMASRIPDCDHTFLPGAKHEILMETDDLRDFVIARTDRFFEQKIR